MKLSRRVLKVGNRPLFVMADGHQAVDAVDRRIDVITPRRNHADDRPKKGNLRRDEAYFADFCNIGGGFVMGEDGRQRGLDVAAPNHLAAIKADDSAVVVKKGGESGRILPIPRLQ